MADAISNTSPLLYLYRIAALSWLPQLFGEVWVPGAVAQELRDGRQRGFDVPELGGMGWIRVVEPRSVPSEWLTRDLGPGELAVLALGIENPGRVVLLDDGLARDIGHAAGLQVWGTLRVLLEAKSLGLTESVATLVDQLRNVGMWITEDVRLRILALAGEKTDLQRKK